ncbi:hypothetical protein C8R45DRAFT_1088269 [Mycena sanguinolenta]|nr:hypothetical protein C8R45DRAFT_1088269 [Mycena sanguinolenta]
MPSEFPSTVVSKGPSWKGFDALKFLVILYAFCLSRYNHSPRASGGDSESYPSVGYNHLHSPIPTPRRRVPRAHLRRAGRVGHLVTLRVAGGETLYNTGARNYLFINVPPINRAPGTYTKGYAQNYMEHRAQGRRSALRGDATVLIYSAWDTFTALLDDPVGHGFPAGDVRRAGMGVWPASDE